MSRLNGDKARFQRLRQAGQRRRDRARATYAELKRRSAASQRANANEQTGSARGRLHAVDAEKPGAADA